MKMSDNFYREQINNNKHKYAYVICDERPPLMVIRHDRLFEFCTFPPDKQGICMNSMFDDEDIDDVFVLGKTIFLSSGYVWKSSCNKYIVDVTSFVNKNTFDIPSE